MRYWDASALVPVHIKEAASTPMRALARADDAVVTWWGTFIECASALAVRLRRSEIAADAYQRTALTLELSSRTWRTMMPSPQLGQDALRAIRVHGLKSGDAIQLAAALAWAGGRGGGRPFVSLDARLRQAALAEGFTVLPT